MKKKLWRILVTGLMIVTLVTGLCACSLSDDKDDKNDKDVEAGSEQQEEISEYVPTSEAPEVNDTSSKDMFKGEYDGWTIFVYLCGADLEEKKGNATGDIDEMFLSKDSDSVRFIVQTGGAKEWHNDYVDATKTQRFLVQHSEIKLVDEKDKLDDMGDSDTLKDFVSWGLENYGAEHNAFILWDHGCGSINGVCIDNVYDKNTLSLRDIDDALSAALGEKKVDFIGFDACLMSTMEMANVLSSYSAYMCASEETIPGTGWNYTAIGTYLAGNPGANGAELGKAACDSYYELCKEVEREKRATLSVLDLSKVQEVATAFDSFCEELCKATEDKTVRANVIRKIYAAENFGGNNRSEGYTNMVDVAGIVDAASEYVGDTKAVKDAVGNLVIYKIEGEEHANACGLSMYYPLSVRGSEELNTFYDLSVSSNYNRFISNRENEEIKAITFSSKPALNEEGMFCFTLDQDGIDNTESVVANVYEASSETGDLIEYGETADVLCNWSTGEVEDVFDGLWISLPDGQNLAIYIVDEKPEYNIYTSPVRIDGEPTNLRIKHNTITGEVIAEGIWDGIDENGVPSRQVYSLEDGDVIEPRYNVLVLGSEEDSERIGSKYTVSGELKLNYEKMEEGDYMYSFTINDIFGGSMETDSVMFYIKGDSTGFYKDLFAPAA